jgi:hypothetical protein
MSGFRPAHAHGAFEEVFPNVFFLRGRHRIAAGLTITKNMVVVRQGDELTLVNSVRLTEQGEADLEALGKVRHLVRLGFFHGADDPYTAHRYAPTFWAPKGQRHGRGLSPDRELRAGESPLEGSSVFLFESGNHPEAALILGQQGGILISCDAYQNWTSFDGCSMLGKATLYAMGFGPTIIGGPWTKRMGPRVKRDFDVLAERDFQHLLPAHGEPLMGTAKEGLRAAVRQRFR